MKFDAEKSKNLLDRWIDSEEAKEYFNHKKKLHEIRLNRYKIFEKYLETHDFDKTMYRILLEHNADWVEKCGINGYEPYPNNKLRFIFDYIEDNYEPIIFSGF